MEKRNKVVYLTQQPKPVVSTQVINHLEDLINKARRGEVVAIATVAVDHRCHLLNGYAGHASEFKSGLSHGLTSLVYELGAKV